MLPRFASLRRDAPPALAPVTLAEAKAWVRYDDADQDDLINGLIAAAVDHLDGWRGVLGRCLIDQAWSYYLSSWPCGDYLVLPFPDCKAIVVEAADGATGVFASVAGLELSGLIETVGGWPARRAVSGFPALPFARPIIRVSFVAGFGPAAADVPGDLRQAILTRVANRFRNRETADPRDIEAAIASYRSVAPL